MSVAPSLLVGTVALCLLATSAAAQDAGSLNPLEALGKAALDTFVQKPLFDPARELPPPAPPMVVDTAPPPPPPPEPPPALQLIGVVHGRHGDMAIVHRDGSEKTVVLRSGDKLGNWTVVVRPPVGVTLREGSRTVAFAIFAKGALPQPGAMPPPGAMPRDLAADQGLRRPRDE